MKTIVKKISLLLLTTLTFSLFSCSKEERSPAQITQKKTVKEDSVLTDYPFPQLPDRVCVVDHHEQDREPPPGEKKLDILFVMDTSSSMWNDWKQVSHQIGSLVRALPQGTDFRFAVVLGHVGSWNGKLFYTRGISPVLDGSKKSLPQISQDLEKLFHGGMLLKDPSTGEATFHSLQTAVTKRIKENRKLGFFREDAALSVFFMSDEHEIGFPFPSQQAPGIPPRCDAKKEDAIKKKYYDVNHITIETAFKALKTIQGDRPLLTNAFVNMTIADLFKDNPSDAKCLYDSLGYGYFDIVGKTNGVLYSIQSDKALGLQKVGIAIAKALVIKNTFELSKPAEDVDATTIASAVDNTLAPFEYDPITNTVHLPNAGEPGSIVEIRHCEPIHLPNWGLENFRTEAQQYFVDTSWSTPQYATTGKILWGTSRDQLINEKKSDGVNTNHQARIEGLQPNTLYFFQVIASDNFGTEKRSNIVNVRTLPDWSIENISAGSSLHSFQVQWTTPQYATAGKILWGSDPNNLNQVKSSGKTQNSHSVIVENVDDNQTYFYQIVANDEYGLERRSQVFSITTKPEWDIIGVETQANRFSFQIKWSTPDYPTSGEVRWGFQKTNLNHLESNTNPSTAHAFFVDGISPNTDVYAQAVSRDEFGRERTSNILTIHTLADWQLGAFQAIPDIRTIAISWNSGDEMTIGKLYWGESETNLENTVNSENGNSTQHHINLNGLNPNTLYYLQAESQDQIGRTKRSNVIAIRTLADPQDPVFEIIGLDGTATETSISLSWNTGEAETNATIYVGLNPNDLSYRVEAISEYKKNHSFVLGGLNSDTTYFIQVVGKNHAGTSRSSQILEIRTLSDWSVEAVQATPAKTAIQVDWSTGSELTKGIVYWGLGETNLNHSIPENTFSNSHIVNISSLTPNTTYFVKVEATDQIGRVEVSPVFEVKTLPDVVAPPFEIKGFDGTTSANSASIIWQTPGVPTAATLYVGLSANDLTFRIVDVADYKESHLVGVAGLNPGTDYYFKVAARNESGFTVESAVIRKKTKTE